MSDYGNQNRHALYKKWRLPAVATFSAISATGAAVAPIEPGTVNPWQIVAGIGAFVALWIAVYLAASSRR